MREILFRGKRIDNGEWVEGSLLRDGEAHRPLNREGLSFSDCYIVPKTDSDNIKTYLANGIWLNITAHHVIPNTVGQYTGFTDKNGKKIFEGDIFHLEEELIAVVIFKDGCFRLQVYGLCGTYTENGYDECGGGWGVVESEPIDWYYIHDMEVIGNIHDNYELLKGENNV